MADARPATLDLARRPCVRCGSTLRPMRGGRLVRCVGCQARFKRRVVLARLVPRAKGGVRTAYRAPALPPGPVCDVTEAAAGLLLAVTRALPMLSRHQEGAGQVKQNVLAAMQETSKALAGK